MLSRQFGVLRKVLEGTVTKSHPLQTLALPQLSVVQIQNRFLHKNNNSNVQNCITTNSVNGKSLLSKSPASAIIDLNGNYKSYATKASSEGDSELINFLAEEIATEKKNQKSGSLPSALDGFSVELNQSEIILKKSHKHEQIIISVDVNHTVDSDYSEEGEAKAQTPEGHDIMRSRPNFEIDIKKGNKILTFSCSYLSDPPEADAPQDEYQDAFAIDEVAIFEGEWNDQVYAVAGDILDGYMYDLLMNMLEERGVTNEFVDKISDFATDYEHRMYINMLTQMQSFLTSK